MKNYLKLIFVVVLGIITFTTSVNAQQKESVKSFNKIKLDMLFGNNNDLGPGFAVGDGGLGVSYIRGYYIKPQFALGIGAEAIGYNTVSTNAIPVFVHLNYDVFPKESSGYIFANIGYSFKTKGNFDTGFLAEGGIGWRFKIKNKFSIAPEIGYRNQHINLPSNLNYTSFGIVFRF